MRTQLRFCLIFIVLVLGGRISQVHAQDWAIKTNLISDATATVNIGTEIGIAPKWTIDISGSYNNWSKNDSVKWKHAFIQPEARYWFCDRFSRHFIGAHLIGGAFNLGNIQNNISIFDGYCISFNWLQVGNVNESSSFSTECYTKVF